MSQRLTMSDIGKLAGVSASTVSRALSNSPSIPQETRERILKIAQEHNYRLDTRAQNFRLGRSQTIATVFPFNTDRSKRLISDPFYLEIIGALTDELVNYDYDMILARVPSYDDEWCLRYMLNNRVDGVFIIDRAVQDRGIERLVALGAPFVVWGPPLPHQAGVYVGCNSAEGGAQAVRHLVSLGRRKIGFIGGDGSMVETSLRQQGYLQGLAEAGIAAVEALMTFTDFTPQAGHNAMNILLERAPDLDAVFLCSDFMAVAALEVLRRHGRRVPEDVSVIGFDDIPLAAYCSPRLTTIRQPIHEGGRIMVQKLLDLIDGKAVESTLMQHELIIRDSCGAQHKNR